MSICYFYCKVSFEWNNLNLIFIIHSPDWYLQTTSWSTCIGCRGLWWDVEVNRPNCWLGSSQRHVLSGVRYLVSRTYRIWVVVWSVLLLSLPVVFVFPQTNILYMSLVFPPLSASASLQGTQKDCLNQCSQVTWPILTLISYMKFGEVWSGTSNAWIFCVYRVSIQSPCLSSVEQDINYEELVQSVLGSNKAAV